MVTVVNEEIVSPRWRSAKTQWVKPQISLFIFINTSLRIAFQSSRVTSEGGQILVRELDHRLGFGELIQV